MVAARGGLAHLEVVPEAGGLAAAPMVGGGPPSPHHMQVSLGRPGAAADAAAAVARSLLAAAATRPELPETRLAALRRALGLAVGAPLRPCLRDVAGGGCRPCCRPASPSVSRVCHLWAFGRRGEWVRLVCRQGGHRVWGSLPWEWVAVGVRPYPRWAA